MGVGGLPCKRERDALHISLMSVNFRFWSHSGCSEKNTNIYGRNDECALWFEARGQGPGYRPKLKMADGSGRRFSCCFSFLLWLLQTSSFSYGGQKLRMVNVVGISSSYHGLN